MENSELTSYSLNQFVVTLRPLINQGKVHTVKHLIRSAQKYRSKKTQNDDQKSQNEKKADRFIEEVMCIKGLHNDDISKCVLVTKKSFSLVGSNGKSTAEERIFCRLAEHKVISKQLKEFREKYPNWETKIPHLLKMLGLRHRKKKLKRLHENGKYGNYIKRESRVLHLLSTIGGLNIDAGLLKLGEFLTFDDIKIDPIQEKRKLLQPTTGRQRQRRRKKEWRKLNEGDQGVSGSGGEDDDDDDNSEIDAMSNSELTPPNSEQEDTDGDEEDSRPNSEQEDNCEDTSLKSITSTKPNSLSNENKVETSNKSFVQPKVKVHKRQQKVKKEKSILSPMLKSCSEKDTKSSNNTEKDISPSTSISIEKESSSSKSRDDGFVDCVKYPPKVNLEKKQSLPFENKEKVEVSNKLLKPGVKVLNLNQLLDEGKSTVSLLANKDENDVCSGSEDEEDFFIRETNTEDKTSSTPNQDDCIDEKVPNEPVMNSNYNFDSSVYFRKRKFRDNVNGDKDNWANRKANYNQGLTKKRNFRDGTDGQDEKREYSSKKNKPEYESNNYNTRNNNSVAADRYEAKNDQPVEKLHPSWEAKRKMKQQTSSIQSFTGSRITFDD